MVGQHPKSLPSSWTTGIRSFSECRRIHPRLHERTPSKFRQCRIGPVGQGVEQVICIAANDIWVMEAWNKAYGGSGVTMLADGNGEISRALGVSVDLRVEGMGTRCARFAMYIDDGMIKAVNQEEKPSACTVTSAQGILERIEHPRRSISRAPCARGTRRSWMYRPI